MPGKDLIIADALSRAPDKGSKPHVTDLQHSKVEEYVNHIISSLPATEERLEQIRREQQQDTVCQRLTQYCQQGWPSRDKLPGAYKTYLTVAAELSIKDGLLMRGMRIVIPMVLQKEILDRLHTGHQGIMKCRLRARQSVWWLHISTQIEGMVRRCSTCCTEQKPRAEPMIPSLLPDRPWHKLVWTYFIGIEQRIFSVLITTHVLLKSHVCQMNQRTKLFAIQSLFLPVTAFQLN